MASLPGPGHLACSEGYGAQFTRTDDEGSSNRRFTASEPAYGCSRTGNHTTHRTANNAPVNIAGPNGNVDLRPTRPETSRAKAIGPWISHGSMAPQMTAGHPSQPRNRPSSTDRRTSPNPRPAPGSRLRIRNTRPSTAAPAKARSHAPHAPIARAINAKRITLTTIAGLTSLYGRRLLARSIAARRTPNTASPRYNGRAGLVHRVRASSPH